MGIQAKIDGFTYAKKHGLPTYIGKECACGSRIRSMTNHSCVPCSLLRPEKKKYIPMPLDNIHEAMGTPDAPKVNYGGDNAYLDLGLW